MVVDVCVAEIKEGCALGLVLEHLDETDALIAAENLSVYIAPRAHQYVTTVKACRLRIKWVLTGAKPSSTFSVITQGLSSFSVPKWDGGSEDVAVTRALSVNLTTIRGLREYLGIMRQETKDQRLSRLVNTPK
jgi:hypothetical protein